MRRYSLKITVVPSENTLEKLKTAVLLHID